MSETAPIVSPERTPPTVAGIRTQLDAVRKEIADAQAHTEEEARTKAVMVIDRRLTDLRRAVGEFRTANPSEESDLESTVASVVDERNALTTTSALPEATAEETPTGFRPPHPSPNGWLQKFDNIVARIGYYTDRSFNWIKERFGFLSPTAASIVVPVAAGLVANHLGPQIGYPLSNVLTQSLTGARRINLSRTSPTRLPAPGSMPVTVNAMPLAAPQTISGVRFTRSGGQLILQRVPPHSTGTLNVQIGSTQYALTLA